MKTLKIIFKLIIAVFIGILIYLITWYGLLISFSKLRKQQNPVTIITGTPKFASFYSFIYPCISMDVPREIRVYNSGLIKIKVWKGYYIGSIPDNLSRVGIKGEEPMVVNEVEESYKPELRVPKAFDLILNSPQTGSFKNTDTLLWDWTITPSNDCHPGNYSITVSGIPVGLLKPNIATVERVSKGKIQNPDTININESHASTDKKQKYNYRVVSDSIAVFNIKVLNSFGLTDWGIAMVKLLSGVLSFLFSLCALAVSFNLIPKMCNWVKSKCKNKKRLPIILP